jgi:hypothetical protein
MGRKVVETMKTPDDRFIYQIGEVDDMGGGFGCMFIDKSSGEWTRTRDAQTVEINYTGEFFPTRAAANAAGRKELAK